MSAATSYELDDPGSGFVIGCGILREVFFLALA